MLETVSIDDAQLSDIEITELRDDPPFHKHAFGTLTVNGERKFFRMHYNVNAQEKLDSQLLAALRKFTEKHHSL